MSKHLILVLATCLSVQGDYNDLFTNPTGTFYQDLSLQNRANVQNGVPAQRLPVNGFGDVRGSIPVLHTEDVTSFSNPPPPVGSAQDPATRTCGIAPSFCTKSRYRSLDGTCNHLENPGLGIPQTPYKRLVPFKYGDGVSQFARSVKGGPLPNVREISLVAFPDKPLVDPKWNLNAQQWGQIITHDMSLTAGVAQSHKDPLVCCDDSGQLAADAYSNPQCAPIIIPPTDRVNAPRGTQCMNFVRTASTRDRGCTPQDTPAQPLSTVTAYMDLSLVYGNSESQLQQIRAFQGGRLITVLRNGREWPPQDQNVTLTCESAQSPNEPCYLTGDPRVNQNPQLTILQVILLREHNRIAAKLAEMNSWWSDETIFQEARRIHIAEIQHINYYEYLPIFLGVENMVKNRLIYPGAQGYITDYNPEVDPSVLDEHATAAFRHFHTLIRGFLDLITEDRTVAGFARMSDWFNRPLLIEVDNIFDKLTRGLTTQAQGFSDQFWDSEITQFLFRRNNTFGGDLRATDIQRGRDHGLGSYVATRAACGLPVPKTFYEMTDFIAKENVDLLATLYEHVEDVDLVVGGSLEVNVIGAQAGPTFLCILTEQFYRTRVGDRYFYETGDPDIAFTPSQLQSIRHGASMARILCDNADNIRYMQPRAFELISTGNRPVLCDQLPAIDLNLWQDHGGAYV
ncbi:peroxidase isoform X2 [Leptidea sinapis]|nr:peroxidase isoform X2 [Leptidea sinapis]